MHRTDRGIDPQQPGSGERKLKVAAAARAQQQIKLRGSSAD